jgi:hypothetical protein
VLEITARGREELEPGQRMIDEGAKKRGTPSGDLKGTALTGKTDCDEPNVNIGKPKTFGRVEVDTAVKVDAAVNKDTVLAVLTLGSLAALVWIRVYNQNDTIGKGKKPQ